ncbi:DUF5667 domain-containing protein [Streptomyces collinus]
MTEHAHHAQPDEQLDPLVADRLAAAQAYLRAHSPLLTPEARASMLQRVKQQAAADERAVPELVSAAPASVPTGNRSLSTGALLLETTGALLTQQRHRRARAFADALENEGSQRGAGDRHGFWAADRPADPEQGRLLALASSLQDLPRPMLDPEAKIVQRAQLIAAMEAVLADGTLTMVPQERDGGRGAHRASSLGKRRPRSAWSRRLAAGGLSVGVAAGAFGGVAAASTDALPGDTLYGLKRGIEDTRLGLADGDGDRGKVYLDLASARLQEARRLVERGRGGALDDESVGEIRTALSGVQRDASEGHRLLAAAYRKDGSLQPIERLSAFSSNHRKDWTQLRGKLPAELSNLGDKVTSVFDAIEQEVAPLRTFSSSSTGVSHGDAERADEAASCCSTKKAREIASASLVNPATGPADVFLPSLRPGSLPSLGPTREDDSNS